MAREQRNYLQPDPAVPFGCRACRWCGIGFVVSLWLVAHCQANDPVDIYILRQVPEKQFKDRLERQARQRIEAMRVTCGLRAEQVEKLQHAASGDVNRAFQEISVIRRATENYDMSNREDMQEAYRLLQPLAQRVQSGIHDEGSLFAKVLERILDESQKSLYQQTLAEKEKRRQHLVTLSTVAAINERVPLLKSQREKLVELIDERPSPKQRQGLEAQLGYVRLLAVPEDELRKLLDAEQLKAINKICEPYKAFAQALR